MDRVVQGHVWERAYTCYDRSRVECDAISMYFVDGMQWLVYYDRDRSGNAIALNSECHVDA